MEKETPKKPDAPKGGDKDIEENKAITFLSYLGVLCLIPLLAKKDSKFAQFHAKQGLVLFIGAVIVSFINIVPFLGQLLFFIVLVFVTVVSIMGLINVAQGEMKKLPIVGDIADKLNL